MLELSEHDYIMTAYAESAAGPGWANSPIWVVIRSQLDGSIRQECIQPDEQSEEMRVLYSISQTAHGAMVTAVNKAFGGDR